MRLIDQEKDPKEGKAYCVVRRGLDWMELYVGIFDKIDYAATISPSNLSFLDKRSGGSTFYSNDTYGCHFVHLNNMTQCYELSDEEIMEHIIKECI